MIIHPFSYSTNITYISPCTRHSARYWKENSENHSSDSSLGRALGLRGGGEQGSRSRCPEASMGRNCDSSGEPIRKGCKQPACVWTSSWNLSSGFPCSSRQSPCRPSLRLCRSPGIVPSPHGTPSTSFTDDRVS